MHGRYALYVMPSVAVLATAALVLGPGRERPAIGARVWGLPGEGATITALRIETMERQFGSDRAAPVDGLELALSRGDRRLAAWTGASGDDGVAEALARSEEPLLGAVELRITRGKLLLAEAPLQLLPARPLTFEERTAEGAAEGALALRVTVPRGVLASPFRGSVQVRVARDGAPAGGVLLKVTADGADLPLSGTDVTTGADGLAAFSVVPTWHAVDLKLEATDTRVEPPLKGTWQGGLPVHPGALFLSLDRPRAKVISPVPRDRAYLSAIGPKGRVFGQVIALTRTDAGLFQGEIDAAELERLGAEAVTLAGDTQERGSGTVTWPLRETSAVASPPRLSLLHDGVPLAESREKKRAGAARLLSVGVALLAALFEAALLVMYSRDQQRKLAAHLAQLGEEGGDSAAVAKIAAAPGARAMSLVLAIGLVVLAFGAVAAFAVVR